MLKDATLLFLTDAIASNPVAMAVSSAAVAAMQKARVEKKKLREEKLAAARKRAQVAREARVGKVKAAPKTTTPKK